MVCASSSDCDHDDLMRERCKHTHTHTRTHPHTHTHTHMHTHSPTTYQYLGFRLAVCTHNRHEHTEIRRLLTSSIAAVAFTHLRLVSSVRRREGRGMEGGRGKKGGERREGARVGGRTCDHLIQHTLTYSNMEQLVCTVHSHPTHTHTRTHTHTHTHTQTHTHKHTHTHITPYTHIPHDQMADGLTGTIS